MDYEVIESGKYHVLVIRERLDFYNITDFKKVLFDTIDGRYTHVAVELKENVNDMSSSVIGALVTGKKKFHALNGSFALVNVGESVRNVFTVAGLADFFTIVDSYDEL